MEGTKFVSTLRVQYDLRECPVTFDFGVFLAAADCERQLRELDSIDLYVRTGEYRRVTPRDRTTPVDDKRWRVKGILAEMCALLPTISSQAFGQSEREPYPDEYLPRFVVDKHSRGADPLVFRADDRAREMVPEADVTLSVRTSRQFPERNPDLKEWFRFYQHLVSRGLNVVVIPDQEDVLGDRKAFEFDWDVYVPASFDMRLRFGLYANAGMNVSSGTAPAEMLFYSPYPVLAFDQRRGNVYGDAAIENMNGYPLYAQKPWSLPNQRMAWVDSDYKSLCDHFDGVAQAPVPKPESKAKPEPKSTRISREELLKRTRTIIDSGMPSLKALKNTLHGDTAVIVGGGPSLADHIGTLRKLSRKRGHHIIATNKTYDYLVKKNFKPWGVLLLDPLPHVADYVKLAKPETKVLLATQCHPKTWEALSHADRYYWVGSDNRFEDDFPLQWLRENYPRGDWELFGGGNTGGLRTIYATYILGCRTFKLIGFDSSHRDGKRYAYDKPIPGDSPVGPATLRKNGHEQEFITDEHMARQVELFEDMLLQMFLLVQNGSWEPIDVKVYGDGMLPSLAAAYGLHADPAMNRKWAKVAA